MTTSPTPHPLDGLRCPPFGIGFERSIAEHTTGVTSTGIPYQGFDYASTLYGKYAGVATMRLSSCLPAFFVSLPDNPRAGITGVQVPNLAGLLVVAESLAFGQAVLDGSLVAIREFARRRALDLAIDGDSLTAIQVPLGSDGLRAYCEDMSLVAASISADPELTRFVVPREPGQGFYGFPGSVYAARDDRLLATLPVRLSGNDHQALDIVALPPARGVQAMGFRHRFQTTTYDGTTVTITNQDDHYVSVSLPFPFGRFGFDWRAFGHPLMLFVPAFEHKHQISADNSSFGSDVARPMLDWLIAMEPPRFGIQDHTMWFTLKQSPTPEVVAWCASFAVEFFDRVELPVWQRLGFAGNPLALDLR
jgi:hypothetical protein